MKVHIVVQRGEELPDSAWASEENAKQRAAELGGPEDVIVWPLDLND